MELLATVMSGFALALLAPALHRRLGRATGWVLALLPLGLFAYFAAQVPALAGGAARTESAPWVPGLDVAIAFHLDGLSLLFALMITGIGALVVVYAGGYLRGERDLGRFYAHLLLFKASMLGLVLADNVVALFVFWELTSLTSYFLIGYRHEDAAARRAALQALLVTGTGGLALLAGLILLAIAGGDYSLQAILSDPEALRGHAAYLPILLLVLAGAFTKSAQFPFHFWLPSAMAAPTPVSAYLHSATMVKAGVYLLARLHPGLGGTTSWVLLLSLFGGATMLLGAVLALTHRDYKRVLAYSTVSALGMMTLLVGLGGRLGAQAAVVLILAHALYKGALFLVAGAVEHGTGERDLDRLGGLRRGMPLVAAAAGLAGLSMMGLPPLFNFVAKELVLEAALHGAHVAVTALLVLASALMVAVAWLAALRPFLGALKPTPQTPHEAPPALLLGPALLALLGLVLGVAPRLAQAWVLGPAADAVAGQATDLRLALWHGVNLPLALSAVSLAAGILLVKARPRLVAARGGLDRTPVLAPSAWYEAALRLLDWTAHHLTRTIQSGILRHYLTAIALVTVAAGAYTLTTRVGLPALGLTAGLLFWEVLVGAMIALAALYATGARSRLTIVVVLGIVGYGIAMVFIFFGAPDLAMTQFLFETLTVVLFVLVLRHMPRLERRSTLRVRLRDGLVAAAFGLLMTTLVLAALGVRVHRPISEFFAASSYVLAHGRNVVNVILVDFRALDTLGEITVLVIAAAGVYALVRLPRRRSEAE